MKISLALKALCEVGPRQLGYYALYQLGLHTGYYRRVTGNGRRKTPDNLVPFTFHPVLHLPGRDELSVVLGEAGRVRLLAEADEVVAGYVRLFGGETVPLRLTSSEPLVHWADIEREDKVAEPPKQGGVESMDIKFIWEPARFEWAYTLGRAYHLSGEERYAQAFWKYVETFLEANPPYLGPHWMSAQEVALRLVAFAFALQIFSSSDNSTPDRCRRLAQAIVTHAERIPPTLAYALAQNNNHLLSEAAGLFTAGVVLPDHPSAAYWRKLGWRWFHRGLQTQIAEDGTYAQHSANYQRLALQLALWMRLLAGAQGGEFPVKSQERLAASTRWLLALLDPESGCLPNLGPNDSAYVLPLTACPFQDYRPFLQATTIAFLGIRPFEAGVLDEMHLWLGEKGYGKGDRPALLLALPLDTNPVGNTPHILRNSKSRSWAYLRVARFTSRPGHADQLHLDLWWRGLNVAQDAGTYLYNAPPPWNNALACAEVHNTVTVNGRDQMTRLGRFLYLDWAQAHVVAHERSRDGSWARLVAQHTGYHRQGVVHQRSVTATSEGRWVIEDALLPVTGLQSLVSGRRSLVASLHWLLPDWPYEFEILDGEFRIALHSSFGKVILTISAPRENNPSDAPPELQIVRAGELLYGAGMVFPVWGWSSPTYGDKIPALSLRVRQRGFLPLCFTSRWIFPLSGQ